VLTHPWIYLAITACPLGREAVRLVARHRAIKLLLDKTHDPASLRYLVQLEQARHRRETGQNRKLGPR
jgi:hypothetical protein